MSKIQQLRAHRYFAKLPAALTILAVAVVGVTLTFNSRAATPFASVEPEQGTLTAGATVGNDVAASGGQFVQFGGVPAAGGGCPAFPEFPNKICTGVPAGTVLTDYGGVTITQDNAVIENVRLTSRVTARANNVTFRNCLINIGPIAIGVDQGFNGLKMENCTFKAGSFIAPFSGLTLRRILVDPDPGAYRPDGIVVSYSGIGHNGQNVLIEDSYTGPQWGEGSSVCTGQPGCDLDHTDAIQMWGFGTISNVTIRHNYIDSTNTNTDPTSSRWGACAFLADGSYVNVTFEYNLCTRTNDVGGYYHLRLASDNPTSGHIIRGNRFGQRGSVVPVDLFRATPGEWSDNRYTDGTIINQPAVRN